MIVDTMNDFEIYKEVEREYNEVGDYCCRISPRYRRAIIKSKQFPLYFKPIEYKSKRGNKYMLYFEARCKKDSDNIIFTMVSLYNKNGGLNAMMFSKFSQPKVIIYYHHLFSRYRTRFLKDETLSSIDVINRFFKINPTSQTKEIIGDEIAGPCNEGVLLGKSIEDGKMIIWKTFVSFDMLFDSQKVYKEDLLRDLLKYRSEIQ